MGPLENSMERLTVRADAPIVQALQQVTTGLPNDVLRIIGSYRAPDTCDFLSKMHFLRPRSELTGGPKFGLVSWLYHSIDEHYRRPDYEKSVVELQDIVNECKGMLSIPADLLSRVLLEPVETVPVAACTHCATSRESCPIKAVQLNSHSFVAYQVQKVPQTLKRINFTALVVIPEKAAVVIPATAAHVNYPHPDERFKHNLTKQNGRVRLFFSQLDLSKVAHIGAASDVIHGILTTTKAKPTSLKIFYTGSPLPYIRPPNTVLRIEIVDCPLPLEKVVQWAKKEMPLRWPVVAKTGTTSFEVTLAKKD